MNQRKQWWLWEVLQLLAIAGAVVLIPAMPMWKYVLLGVCFGLYATFHWSQQSLCNERLNRKEGFKNEVRSNLHRREHNLNTVL